VARRRIDFVCIAAVLLFAACASAPPPAPVAPVPVEPAAELSSADINAVAELLRMEDVRRLDTALVARHLLSANREVRARAALAAGRILDRTATPLLLRALNDPHPYVRSRAAFALGELGDTSTAVIEALGNVALARDVAPAVEAIGALGQLARPRVTQFVDSLLTRSAVHDSVRYEALLVASRLARDSVPVESLARWTRNPDAELRWRAAYSLARRAGPRAVPALVELVNDPDPRVRDQAVRGMNADSAESAGLRERAFAAVMAATQDSSALVRINAIAQLGSYRNPTVTTPRLIALLQSDPVGNVRVAAASALRDPVGAPALAAVANSTAPMGVRTAALTTLAAIDAQTALPIAVSWAADTSWVYRVFAARTLQRAPWNDAANTLQQLARDQHYLVAAAALNALAAGDSLPQKRAIFIERLAVQHVLPRAAAVRGLARYATIADLDVLLQAYGRAQRDDTREALAAVVNALIALRRDGVPVDRTLFLRFQNAPPADARLFRLISDSIGTPPASWIAPEPRTESRELGFYAEIVRRYVAPVIVSRGEAPLALITTPHGEIRIQLASAEAPLTVHNFVSLIERGFYANTRWHRVVPNFVIQAGSANGDGSGGPGYSIRDEINTHRYLRGTLGMALSGPDTGGSQWFITHSPTPHLDGGYTIFGHVIAGMDVVDRVVQEEPILGFRVIR
jgi:cyclophilin family peptidyl-prolyl cis-trans isomerase